MAKYVHQHTSGRKNLGFLISVLSRNLLDEHWIMEYDLMTAFTAPRYENQMIFYNCQYPWYINNTCWNEIWLSCLCLFVAIVFFSFSMFYGNNVLFNQCQDQKYHKYTNSWMDIIESPFCKIFLHYKRYCGNILTFTSCITRICFPFSCPDFKTSEIKRTGNVKVHLQIFGFHDTRY